MGKATQDLRKEHETILYVLQILDNMMASDTMDLETKLGHYGEVVYFLKIFADKCHHGKEENILFKTLVEKGIPNENGPIGVMLSEHTLGREYIAGMGKGSEEKNINKFNEAAGQYAGLLRQHIDKENKVLFVMADQLIGEEEQDRLFDQFEKHEEEVIGHGVHERLHAMIGTWADALSME